MELFEEIRRGYAAGETIKSLARKHGIHRRMVRQAIASAMPPKRKMPSRLAMLLKSPWMTPIRGFSTAFQKVAESGPAEAQFRVARYRGAGRGR